MLAQKRLRFFTMRRFLLLSKLRRATLSALIWDYEKCVLKKTQSLLTIINLKGQPSRDFFELKL